MTRKFIVPFCASVLIISVLVQTAQAQQGNDPQELLDCYANHVENHMQVYHNVFHAQLDLIKTKVDESGSDVLKAYMDAVTAELAEAEEAMRAALMANCNARYQTAIQFAVGDTKRIQSDQEFETLLFGFVQALYQKWNTYLTLDAQATTMGIEWRVFRFVAVIRYFGACRQMFLQDVGKKKEAWREESF
ncbi:MAG: hypothetical protein AB7K09_07305 [Planctomycetota bacterium]